MDWLYVIVVVLVILWVAGLLLKIGGKLIHIILVLAVGAFLLNLFNVL